MGLSSLESAIKVKDAHPLNQGLLVYRRKNKSGYLYLIVGHIYNSKLDADNAKVIYAQRGYSGKPWVKSIKAVQTEISALN